MPKLTDWGNGMEVKSPHLNVKYVCNILRHAVLTVYEASRELLQSEWNRFISPFSAPVQFLLLW